jgi:hypothetical protein
LNQVLNDEIVDRCGMMFHLLRWWWHLFRSSIVLDVTVALLVTIICVLQFQNRIRGNNCYIDD